MKHLSVKVKITIWYVLLMILMAGLLLGFLVFGQLPDGYSLLGYVIIIAVAILMFLYNTQRLPQKYKRG